MSSNDGRPPALPGPGAAAQSTGDRPSADPAASAGAGPSADPAAPAAEAVPSTDPAEAVSSPDPAASAGAGPRLNEQRIAERVAVLDSVSDLPLVDHVELYQRLHAELQSALAEIDGP
ncbi:MAG: hypothetical protein M3Y44_00790 [Actinomycetota bacterium]|nr:hypothetical protein [Actinomycetota bacterium]